MTKKLEVYKCEKCGNIVEVLHNAGGSLVCCGQKMTLMEENTVDAAKEKHVPVIEKNNNNIKVKVGSTAHPMMESHYIEWIDVVADNKVYRKFLNPEEQPEASFDIEAEQVTAKAYCNLHGLWKS